MTQKQNERNDDESMADQKLLNYGTYITDEQRRRKKGQKHETKITPQSHTYATLTNRPNIPKSPCTTYFFRANKHHRPTPKSIPFVLIRSRLVLLRSLTTHRLTIIALEYTLPIVNIRRLFFSVLDAELRRLYIFSFTFPAYSSNLHLRYI